jgi:hypothetical protein
MEISEMKTFNRIALAMSAVLFSGLAAATPGPYDAITSAVDFSDVNGVVAAIAGGLALAYVFIKGAKLGLALLRG